MLGSSRVDLVRGTSRPDVSCDKAPSRATAPERACARVGPAEIPGSPNRGDNRRTIARLSLTLLHSKYGGQSIAWLFFELFHYGPRFARLDRCHDMKCHA